MVNKQKQVAVIGAGAWGTALSVALTRAGCHVVIWAFEEDVVQSINQAHENTRYLPGITLPNSVTASHDVAVLVNAESLFWVVPAQHLRSVAVKMAMADIPNHVSHVICTKGIENKTNALMTEVLAESFPLHPKAVLAGPNFAEEVAAGSLAATTIACDNNKSAERIATLLRSNVLKVTTCDDVVGAQVCGTAKNVLAIACGILMGMGYGESTKAAAITSGFHEIQALVKAKGGTGSSLIEFSGIGDLVLTCGSAKSRNMSLGFALGKGESLESLLSNRQSVAEGVASALSIHSMTDVLGVKLPLCEAVYQVLYNNGHVEDIARAVFS
ncbi:MAG: NAD(P)-dependent glycerol-3-phosphate dehydrogenase [Alphaproteobacteria bacterium]|nr:NAD(P)-dependent glycerol-3-phosphate dehydrogenase [Alphaproteobacteria bacterium]